MGTRAVDPMSIRNVTIAGAPAETARVVHRLPLSARTGSVHRVTDGVEHTIRVAELSSHAPLAELERSLRVADGTIAVLHAAAPKDPDLEAVLRVADDHQVARMCLVTGLDHPDADFDRCVRAVADTRGATPLRLHLPSASAPNSRVSSTW